MVNNRKQNKVGHSLGKNYFTFMLIPQQSDGKVFRINMPKWLLGCLVFFIVSSFILFAGSLFYSSHISSTLIETPKLKAENQKLIYENQKYAEDTKRLKIVLQELKEKDREIRTLLGMNTNYKSTKTASLKKKNITSVSRSKEIKNNQDLESVITELYDDLSDSTDSYENLSSTIKQLKKDFDYVPSIWPIYGYIRSGYGWRRHPIFGRSEFHRGLDIPAFQGANVRATATGTVTFAGWASGYGETVVITHKYGYATIYGHNSRLLVKNGDTVKKGQVISEAGSTGLSTGPHVHYEIRRWRKAINPNTYLKMDIFTASRLIR